MARRQARRWRRHGERPNWNPRCRPPISIRVASADVGRFADAIRAFEHAQTLDPQSSFISALISYAYARKGDTQHA